MITNQFLAAPSRKATFLPKKICTNELDQIQETSHYLYERKKFSVADLLSRSFVREQLQPSHVKRKQLPPQILLATLTHDDQIKFKPVQYLVKRETALPSLKDDCHPSLAHLGNHQFPNCNEKEVEKNVVHTPESFLFDAVQSIQVLVNKLITKNAKTLCQQFFF